MKRQAPTERAIVEMMASAYEQRDQPDPRRLAAIEQHLLDQPRLRARKQVAWWWLIAALATGAASAWWWTVNYDSYQGLDKPAMVILPPVEAPAALKRSPDVGRAEDAESNAPDKPTSKTGPVIYQRER